MKDLYKLIGIYRITNIITGSSYIGKTGMNFGDRWDSHRSLLNSGRHDNRHLQNAWNKYGKDNFEFAVVEVVENTDNLNNLEIEYIRKYKEMGKCYNISPGGDGGANLGKHLSDETKRKIGEKNRKNMTGRKLSAETRKKMSDSQKRRVWTEDQLEACKEKSRAANTGRVRSDETKELLRKINQENPPSAKYSPDDIRTIRKKKADGALLRELAAEYHTTESYISSIVHGRRWGHIV